MSLSCQSARERLCVTGVLCGSRKVSAVRFLIPFGTYPWIFWTLDSWTAWKLVRLGYLVCLIGSEVSLRFVCSEGLGIDPLPDTLDLQDMSEPNGPIVLAHTYGFFY